MPEPAPRRKYVCYCYTFLNLGDLLPCLLQSHLFYIYFAKHRKAAPFVLPDIIRPSALLISLTPKFAVSVCELHVSVFLEYQQCAFSFEVSHEPRNAHFGRRLTSICMWSGHTSPSIISTPFHWQSWRSISRISRLFSAKNTFRLYFGANTIWYLQFQPVCAKLLLFMGAFFIDKSSKYVFSFDWQVDLIISYLEDFASSVNLYRTTRLSRGFRLTTV